MRVKKSSVRATVVRAAGVGLAAVLAVALVGCSSGGGSSSLSGDHAGQGNSGSTGSASTTPVTIGAVSSISNEVWMTAQQDGDYSDAGLSVKITTVDSGPALVTGVVNGTYDVAISAALPAIVALAKGVDLKLFNATSVVAPDHGTSGLMVKKGSSITSYKDLEGKKVATNALTSLNVLATKMAMKQAGANPDDVHFVALPFKSSLQAVHEGQVDAAVVISPFIAEGVAAGLDDIGDPIADALPEGAPYNIALTSAKTASAKASVLDAFNKASNEAVKKLAADPDLMRTLAQSDSVGLSKELAQAIKLPEFSADPVDVAKLQQLADAAYRYGFIDKKIDIASAVFTP